MVCLKDTLRFRSYLATRAKTPRALAYKFHAFFSQKIKLVCKNGVMEADSDFTFWYI